METETQTQPQPERPTTETPSAAPAVDPNLEKALAILRDEPFQYNESQAASALKRRGAAAILTQKGQFLTLLDEFSSVVPFQLVARLEKLVEKL